MQERENAQRENGEAPSRVQKCVCSALKELKGCRRHGQLGSQSVGVHGPSTALVCECDADSTPRLSMLFYDDHAGL